MGNHIHILIKEGKEDLGMAMRRIGASYVYWYNWRHDWVGHLFQDRCKSEVVEDDTYLLTVLRYIHQNPLKAKMVEDIKKYTWSSYLEYTEKNKIVDSDFILNILHSDRKKAITEFIEFHEQEGDGNCLDISEQKRIKDEEAIGIIKDVCQINHCTDLQRLKKDCRDRYLNMIKEQGLSTRQIARLTGISRSIILKV